MQPLSSTKTMALLLFCMSLTGLADEQARLLWQLGQPDNDTAEFGLARGRYHNFTHDGFFVLGRSNLKRDWPYVHPGPADVWAGGRSHTFTVVFALKAAPKSGNCQLVLDFADTHSRNPPKLQIDINGRSFIRNMPRGAGDASVSGEPSKGREHRSSIRFPAKILTAGNNELSITTLSGSWVLYDCVQMTGPEAAQVDKAPASGTTIRHITSPAAIVRKAGKLYQTLQVQVLHLGKQAQAKVGITGAEPVEFQLQPGQHTVELFVPPIETESEVTVTVEAAGQTLASRKWLLKPVRKWQVYLLHHSHVDIGYTHVQTEVERKHWGYFEQAIELARKTADYPAGSQFKWNVEVLWAVDSYLKQASEEKRKQFIETVKKGQIGLDALYGNELTALCRPEELIRLVDYASQMRRSFGLTIDSAMITDVPGYTWGIVPVLAHSGVKYFSVGPNRGHRIGYTLSTWGDKPFYWQSPSAKCKILCWVAGEGYSFFHSGRLQAGKIFNYLKRLENSNFPYDIVQVRYSIGGDNGPPDPKLSDFVKDWNAKYAYPRLVIATTSEMFHQFERQYGHQIPKARGDFTPYWEDGAASSALETAINRAAAERLVQAEALWAMLQPARYPAQKFYNAWRNVILYDEHTWGAHCSISQPDSDFTQAQWNIKQAFALHGDAQSRKLLNDALAGYRSSAEKVAAVDVFNTCSWERTDLVLLPKDLPVAGDIIKGPDSRAVPAQRLSTGELAFLAQNVPPWAAKRFTFHAGKLRAPGNAKTKGTVLSNDRIVLTVDKNTGGIKSLKWKQLNTDLVSRKAGPGLNDYLYVAGRDPKEPQRNGPVKFRVKEHGPLVASLLIESDAPGCNKLTREIRLVAGLDRVDIINIIDKQKNYKQEAVHLAFAFNIPHGVPRMDSPWAVVRPEVDQLPGACKNYFTVQRWVDVSNEDYGVTWATVDAPLVEVGAISCDPRAVGWLRHIEPSATLYSYVMNNYWETNYKAGQEGPTTFRYSIKPHQRFDPAEATRFGIERSQPLIAVAVDKEAPLVKPLLRVQPEGVIATAFKPSKDGMALIVRLFNVSGQPKQAKLSWAPVSPVAAWLSNFAEERVKKVKGPIEIAMTAYEIVTLRVPLD